MEILSDILNYAGLDDLEAKVYSTLLEKGSLSILEIATNANVKRTNLYNIMDDLEKKNLVTKVIQGKTTKYFPQSPKEIQKLLELRENQFSIAKNTFELLIDNLQSKYNLVSNKPEITYLEGIKGLQKMYQDILDTKEDILLFRSHLDNDNEEVNKVVQKQIVEQVKRGIHARVIGPKAQLSKKMYLDADKLRLVERRIISKFDFKLPAQIVIYGTKTAIADLKENITITIIDNPDITQTFKILFDFVWVYSTPEHEELLKTW